MGDIREGADLSLAGSEVEGPGGDGEVQPIHNACDEDGLQVPGVGRGAGNHPVLGQCNHGAVVEYGQQHNQQRREIPAGNRNAIVALFSSSVVLQVQCV